VQDVGPLVRGITESHGYVVSVTVQEIYFEH
jgi:hypothetical protein